MQIHLVSTVKTLELNECVRLWHYANKFQNREVMFHIGLENEPDQHHLTSLITKLDWERKNNNQNLDFKIYFAPEIYAQVNPQYEFRYVLIEQYLKEILKLDYIVYIHSNILFSQQSTDLMWINIDLKTNWFGGDSLIYGKNLQKESEWTYLPDYPILTAPPQDGSSVAIGIFNNETVKSTYYSSWNDHIKNKYLDGTNLFYWEKNHVAQL